MSSTTTQNVPGMSYPTQKGMLAGNPRDSAMQQMTNTNTKQASLSAAVGGRKKRSKHRGGDANSTIAVPQYQMLYTPQGGTGTDPNNQIQQNSQISTQGVANAVYDQDATKTGGTRRIQRRSSKGGYTKWGCYSGGKKKTKKNKKSKKSRKSRKTKKRN
jgi:hypothetical protein